MTTAVLPTEACDPTTVVGSNNVSPCLIGCFRGRETFKHGVKIGCFPSPDCSGVPSCQEMLAAAKTAKFQLVTGTLMRTVTIGDKQFTANPASLTGLEQLIYELECECGCYAGSTCAPRSASKAPAIDGCGCSGGCSGGCGCGGGKPSRLFTGYL